MTRAKAIWCACALVAASWLWGGAAAGEALVYRVGAEGLPDGYLVGTMHTEDPRVMALVEDLEPLIERVDVVAIELLPDAVSMVAVGAATLLSGDNSLRDILGTQRFRAAARLASRRGIGPAMLDRLKPWAAAVMLGMPEARSGQFFDAAIYLEGMAQGKRLVGIETVAEQVGVFERLPLADQAAMLDQVVKNADNLPQQYEALTEAYLRGDLARLEQLSREQFADLPAGVAEWFQRALIDERNARMVARIEPLMREAPALVAVGALHLAGDTGLVQQLRRCGFTVRRWQPGASR
jgi:uncharacterized protein YbaP (TraB family)